VKSPLSETVGRQGVGQLFAAVDVGRLVPLDDVEAWMQALVETMRASASGDPGADILVPGEREARVADQQRRIGIALPHEVQAAVLEGAKALGITPPPSLR